MMRCRVCARQTEFRRYSCVPPWPHPSCFDGLAFGVAHPERKRAPWHGGCTRLAVGSANTRDQLWEDGPVQRLAIVSLVVAGLVAASVSVGIAAQAANRAPRAGGVFDREVLLGEFECGVRQVFFQDGLFWIADASYSLNATGDIFLGDFEGPFTDIGDRIPGDTLPPELVVACEEATDEALALVQSSGCAAGEVVVRSDVDFNARDFNFVCEGRRSALVSVIGATARSLLD